MTRSILVVIFWKPSVALVMPGVIRDPNMPEESALLNKNKKMTICRHTVIFRLQRYCAFSAAREQRLPTTHRLIPPRNSWSVDAAQATDPRWASGKARHTRGDSGSASG